MKPRPVFLASADWHLCRSAWADRRVRGDSAFGLGRLVDLAIRLRVPLVAAGDLFDSSTTHPADVACAREQMTRMEQAGLPVYYIQGQHERVVDLTAGQEGPTPWLSAASTWPTHIHGKTIQIGDFKLVGLDFQSADRLKRAMDNLQARPDLLEIDFLVAHQVWSELSKGSASAEGKLADLPGRMNVITGDLHQTCVAPIAEDRWAYSPGAIHRLAIDEPDKHHAWLCYDNGIMRAVRFPSRYIERVKITDEQSLSQLLTDELTFVEEAAADHARRHRLPVELRRPLLRVEYPAGLPGALSRMEEVTTGHCHLFAKAVEPDTENEDQVEVQEIGPGLLAGLEAFDLTAIAGEHKVDEAELRETLVRLLGSLSSAALEVAALIREKLQD